MSLKFERKLPIILFFVFLMLTTIGFAFYQSTVSLQEVVNWEKRSQEVVSTLDETMTLILEIEDGVRRLIITGNETYLDSGERSKSRISQNISRLRVLTTDSTFQIDGINQLESLYKDFLDETVRRIDVRKSQGYEAAIPEISRSQDKAVIDAVRALIVQLKAEEFKKLQIREQGLDAGLYRTIWILIISSLAGIISLAWVNYIVWHEIRRRQTAEDGLVDANRELEVKVKKRTSQLQKANEALSESAVERELLLRNEQEARQEAEIANRLRDEFMATVSHELRTPLNSILGWSRMLKEGTLDIPQAEKAVATIIKNSETQHRLIEDLMDVARIISGKLELDLKSLDPAEIVIHSIDSVRPSATAKQITIDLQTSDNVHAAAIRGDSNRLQQVFTNLLTNAIKFSPEKTTITVKIGLENEFVWTTVADHGMGISRGFLPRVFERFRQETTAPSRNGGLGLGLAIVRNLVEMHGGTVSVESEGTDKGSIFSIRLPVGSQESEVCAKSPRKGQI